MSPSDTAPSTLARIGRWLLRPSAIYLASSALAKAGALLLIPLYTRRLSPSDYGDYALAQTLFSSLPTLVTLGLLSALTRFYFSDGEPAVARLRVGALARWLAVFAVGITAFLQVLVISLVPPGRHGLFSRWELSCVLWAGAGSAIAQVPSVYLRAARRAIPAACFQLGQFFSLTAGGLIMVAGLGRGLRGAIEAGALAYVLDGAIGIVFILGWMPGRMTRPLLREALRFSLPFVPHFAANQLQAVSDRWVLKAAGLDAALGTYALAQQLTAPSSMVMIAYHDAASPEMGEAHRARGMAGLRAVFSHFERRYLLAAALPLGATLLGLPFAGLLIGRSFAAALWFVPLLGIALLVESFYYPNSNVLFFGNRTGRIPVITITTGVASLILTIVLVWWLGVYGAVLARISAMALRSAAMAVAARRCFADQLGAPPRQEGAGAGGAAGPSR